jgi:hypothetical protein
MTWDEAIQIVLSASDGPLHYSEIAERIATEKLYEIGANPNPAATVASILSQSINRGNSPFQRVGTGLYGLKSKLQADAALAPPTASDTGNDSRTGALRAFGMYWQRERVNWEPSSPKLFGHQSAGAADVNFAEQIGVYLLHDRDRVIYVGRATDTLVARLRAHISDRLGGRWDRFSWFGLRGVGEDGALLEDAVPWNQTVVIETLEALLIESLEPPLNRRRGDNFSAVEYLQGVDPAIERIRQERFLAELGDKLRQPQA